MKKILCLVGLTLLVSCEGNTPTGDKRTRIPTNPKELAVWNAAYDTEYKYPDGFYSEPKEWSISYLGDNVTENGKFFYKQRSTDSREQAREWWNSMMKDNTDQPTLQSENETSRYFELIAVTLRGHTTRWRFHKSSYYTPTAGMFNTFYYIVLYPELYKPYTIGVYGGELSKTAVREFIESLWYFETYRMGGDKVLSTYFKETSNSFVYTVKSIGISYGDWNLNDEIRVFESSFELDKKTREFRSTDCALLQTIQGVYHTGVVW